MARTTDAKAGRLVQRPARPAPTRSGLAIFDPITRYIHDVRAELARVDWPSRKELTSSTLIVLVVLAVLSVYLGAWDYLFTVSVRRWLVGP